MSKYSMCSAVVVLLRSRCAHLDARIAPHGYRRRIVVIRHRKTLSDEGGALELEATPSRGREGHLC